MSLYYNIDMILYYGSKTDFKTPTYGLGNPSNDYGLGFYCSDDEAMARLWASQFEDGGFVIEFSLDDSLLKVLPLSGKEEEDVLRWITLLVRHRFSYRQRLDYQQTIDWLIRHFDTPINEYDMVVGYRADDSYFRYSLGFVSGDISLETLTEAMQFGRLGRQYVLLSKAAFGHIHYRRSYAVPHNDDYAFFRAKTLGEFHALAQKEDRIKNTFIGDLFKKYGQ